MPTYSFQCPEGHIFDLFSSISAKPDAPPCEHTPEGVEGATACGLPAKQVFTSMPSINDTNVMILDYPGSKRLKAGYVHAYVDPGVKKVSVGAGGALNPSTSPRHPLAQQVRPEWKPGGRPRNDPRG